MRMRRLVLAAAALVASLCFSSAGQAHGFLEMLFGGHAAPQRYVVDRGPSNARPLQHYVRHKHAHPRIAYSARAKRHHAAKVLAYLHVEAPRPTAETAAAAPTPTIQEALVENLRNDPTLRTGDAIMTPQGLRIYVGARAGGADIVPVEQARNIGRWHRQRLAEITPVRAQERASASQPTAQAAGSHGKMIHAANGKTVRLVGGYAR